MVKTSFGWSSSRHWAFGESLVSPAKSVISTVVSKTRSAPKMAGEGEEVFIVIAAGPTRMEWATQTFEDLQFLKV